MRVIAAGASVQIRMLYLRPSIVSTFAPSCRAADGPTWDSVQLQMIYAYPDGREAAFDIHTSWVTPDNFPGYVEQEVQFRFDNGVWNAHQRKRGVEVTVEGRSPHEIKNTPNHHYNGTFIEPWGERSQRGYGIEILQRFLEEVAYVEYGGPPALRAERLEQMRCLSYNDLTADRPTVAAVQALEALLQAQAAGFPGSIVRVNGDAGGLVLYDLVRRTLLLPSLAARFGRAAPERITPAC